MTPAERADLDRVSRRCNDEELSRLAAAFAHAVDVVRLLNCESVQIVKAELVPDQIPNSVGCRVLVELFVYAPQSGGT